MVNCSAKQRLPPNKFKASSANKNVKKDTKFDIVSFLLFKVASMSMKKSEKNFALACLLVFVFVVGLKTTVLRDEGQAQASSVAILSDVAEDGFEYSSVRRRHLSAVLARDPERLLTLKGRDVRQVFRIPELVRSDLPTVVWQYRGDACVLDIYFTASKTDVSDNPVVHYEIRERNTRDASHVSDTSCMEEITQPRMRFVSLFDFSGLYKAGRR